MKRYLLILLAFAWWQAAAQMQWHDPLEAEGGPAVQGRLCNAEIGKSFQRLPDRLQPELAFSKWLWHLSRQNAGLYVQFYTNAPEITIRYKVANDIAGNNMAPTGKSGIDLYVCNRDGHSEWIPWIRAMAGIKQPADTIVARFKELKNTGKNDGCYTLYLPLYNHVDYMQIGVPEGCKFYFAPNCAEDPVVVYGTSITQGACASRPGLAWTNLLQQAIDRPVVNLGFSGSAQLHDPIFRLMAQPHVKMYLICCMENMGLMPDSIAPRLLRGVAQLRAANHAPIVLAEHCGYEGRTEKCFADEVEQANKGLKEAYRQLREKGYDNIYYISREALAMPAHGRTEGVHPNDIGMVQMAKVFAALYNEVFDIHPTALFPPVQQYRDRQYEWKERHNQVLELNRTTDPEILMIGNSITHFWSGNPVFQKIHLGDDSWREMFGTRRVTNMGYGWDRIENVIWRIYHGELDDCAPRKIFMLIGINNIDLNTDQEIVDGTLEIIRLIRQKQPQAHIYVQSVYPRAKYEKRVSGYNKLLRSTLEGLADDKVTFVNVYPVLLKEDGSGLTNTRLFTDGLHPNTEGYARIAKVLKPYVDE